MQNTPVVSTEQCKLLLATEEYLKEHPGGRIITDRYLGTSLNRTEYRAWFRRCLDEKINILGDRQRTGRAPQLAGTGRKWDYDYQTGLQHDRRRIWDYLHRRLRHSGCRNLLYCKELQIRYPEINNQPRED